MKMLVIFIAGIMIPAALMAQLTGQWVVGYDYEGGQDYGKDIAFDGSGNAYVLTNTNSTIKYSRSGVEEWVRTFPWPAVAAVADAAGSTYVAGSNGSAIVTVKYSSVGDVLWERHYRPVGGVGSAAGIALDAFGNIHVGGSWENSQYEYYLTSVKYNSAGEVQWSGTWQAPYGEFLHQSEATGLAVDGLGNAFVCGYYLDNYGGHSATAKFSDGQAAWAHIFDETRLSGIAADPAGNSFVFNSAFVTKYDADGDICWTKTPSFSTAAVVTDAAGNLYVAGSAYRSRSYDFAVVKYNAGGDLVWDRYYDGGSDDYPTALAMAGNGNVYATGHSMGTGGNNDYATVGYTSSGDLVGSARYDGPASNDDRAWAVATGPGGLVCVTGQAAVAGHGYDIATVLYSLPAAYTDDVGVTKITEPSGVVDTLTETPKATVHNHGMVTSSFEVWFEIRDSATNAVVYLQSSTVTDLGPDENRSVSFTDWEVPNHEDVRYVSCAWTYLPGDVYPQNDMAGSDFVVEGKQQGPPAWTPWTDVPAGPHNRVVQHGAAMATDPMGLFVYLLKGNNTCEFYRFDPATATWLTLDPIPERGRDNVLRAVKEGGTLAQVGGKFYATKGGNSLEFWEYDPVAAQGSRWTQKPDVPAGSKGVSNGAGAVGAKDGDASYVFLLKASGTSEAYWYSVSGDQWDPNSYGPPGDKDKKWAEGSCVTFDGIDTVYALKGEHNELYAYSVSANTWLAKPDLPLGPKDKQAKGGAAICYHAGKVYCIKGSNSQEFWVYDRNSGTWTQGPDVTLGPRKTRVQDGGALLYCRASRYLFATKGNCLELWSYGRLSNYDGPAGVVSVPMPIRFSLAVSPSVTSSQARVRYAMPEAGNVRLKFYEVTGRCAAVLRDGWCEPGRYTANLSARGLARGVYILKLESDAGSLTRKVVIE